MMKGVSRWAVVGLMVMLMTAPVSAADFKKLSLKVYEMNCKMCLISIESALRKLPGVERYNLDITTEMAEIQYHEKKVTPDEIIKAIKKIGYDVEVSR